MNLSLSGKYAFVGGASAGIGRAVARELALLGASVVLCARTAETLQQVLDTLDTAAGQRHSMVVADYADSAGLIQKVEAVLTRHPLHILINNTGGPPGGPITAADAGAFAQAFHNHLLCNQLLAKVCLPGMQEAGFGRIINIISTSVKEPIDNLGVSNTTRWAVAAWAKTWANEAGRWGVTVNNVLPGFTSTGRLDEIVQKRAEASGKPEAEIAEAMQLTVPMRRFGTPEEVAAAVAFLASPAASYINGINLPVDGGRTRSL